MLQTLLWLTALIYGLSFVCHNRVFHAKTVLTPMIFSRPLRSSMEKAVMFLASSRARSLRSTLSSSSSQMAGTTLDRYRNTLGQNLSQTAQYRQTDSPSRYLYLYRRGTHPTKYTPNKIHTQQDTHPTRYTPNKIHTQQDTHPTRYTLNKIHT